MLPLSDQSRPPARPQETPGRLGTIPRRALCLSHYSTEAAPPQMRVIAFRASRLRTLRRLCVWVVMLLGTSLSVAWDQLRGRNTKRRRAMHLGRAFQRMGGTFIRIGQRLAIHADLRQSPYGEEIAHLQDVVPPFPAALAVAAIERTTGKPLHATFAQFDPEPVLSTSTACAYQALLLSGERVVAKVRRPGAGEQLVADLRLVDWVASALEFFSVVRKGYTREVRRELREALLEEFDFIREARHQAAFRRTARRTGKKFFSAPRVHFDLSSEDVIVQEFVSGMWLWELMAAVEQGHEGVLALAAELNIDPKKVARRLLWVSFWSWHENLFFLAEPNPHNIILSADGKLFFIDFTSTGAIDHTMKRAMQQNMYYAIKRDPLNMARASLTLLEPLPPVNAIELTKEIENANLQMLYAFETKPTGRNSPPRTSLTQWRGLLESAGRFGIAVDYGVLRLIRAAVMHEILALRLSPDIDVLKQYRRFVRSRADRSADPGGRPARRRVRDALNKKIYLRLEHLAKAAEGFVFRLRHLVSLPRVNFNAMISKSSFAFLTLVTFLTQVFQLTAVAALFVMTHYGLAHERFTVRQLLQPVWESALYQGAIVVLFLINGRALLFRLDDKDV